MVHHLNRIVVPQRQVQGGFDFKFETDPYDVKLFGLLTPEQYTDAITAINERLKPSRCGRVDGMLLAAGPLILPLAIWGIRHSNQTKRRKKLLKKAIAEFHQQYPHLLMRWNRRPESMLTIERQPAIVAAEQQQQEQAHHVMVEAQFVSDVIAPTEHMPSTAPAQTHVPAPAVNYNNSHQEHAMV